MRTRSTSFFKQPLKLLNSSFCKQCTGKIDTKEGYNQSATAESETNQNNKKQEFILSVKKIVNKQ